MSNEKKDAMRLILMSDVKNSNIFFYNTHESGSGARCFMACTNFRLILIE